MKLRLPKKLSKLRAIGSSWTIVPLSVWLSQLSLGLCVRCTSSLHVCPSLSPDSDGASNQSSPVMLLRLLLPWKIG
jgi:hypothetical protein